MPKNSIGIFWRDAFPNLNLNPPVYGDAFGQNHGMSHYFYGVKTPFI
jgi:hypothetical protein